MKDTSSMVGLFFIHGYVNDKLEVLIIIIGESAQSEPKKFNIRRYRITVQVIKLKSFFSLLFIVHQLLCKEK